MKIHSFPTEIFTLQPRHPFYSSLWSLQHFWCITLPSPQTMAILCLRDSLSPGSQALSGTSHPFLLHQFLSFLVSTFFFSACHCHDCDTRSTLYHSVRLCPRIYHPFHCMYLRFPIISILLVSPPIGKRFVQSVFPNDYLICFHLRSRLLSVPILLYLLIQYASGNQPQTSPGLLIALHELCWSSACPTP